MKCDHKWKFWKIVSNYTVTNHPYPAIQCTRCYKYRKTWREPLPDLVKRHIVDD